jgi:prolipoprotein diacylglyceryltransferase
MASGPFAAAFCKNSFFHMQSSIILFTVGRSIFVTYGLWMAMGMVSASTACIFYMAKTLSWTEIPNQMLYLPLSIIAWSIFGARLFSMIFEDGFQKLLKTPLKAILRPGFWLHGGLAFLLLAVFANRNVISHPLVFFDGVGLGFPLYEAFSRIGCHSYGCCFGKRVSEKSRLWTSYHDPSYAVNRIRPDLLGKRLFPVQLLSALFFFSQFWVLMMAPAMKPGMLFGASLLFHSIIRLVTETFRDDPRGAPTLIRLGPLCFYYLSLEFLPLSKWPFQSSQWWRHPLELRFLEHQLLASNSPLVTLPSPILFYFHLLRWCTAITMAKLDSGCHNKGSFSFIANTIWVSHLHFFSLSLQLV